MAFLGIRVPITAAQTLAAIPVPTGKPLSPEEMHITLFYLGKDIPIVSSLGSVIASHMVAKNWKPFDVHAALLTSFPSGEDGTPVIVRVISQELMEFRAALKQSMDKMNVPYSNKYPEYKPHITLTYASESIQPAKIKPISWKVDRLHVWAGEDMDSVVESTVFLMG